ncbi:MAG: hydroxymethylglutaryl-CoA synthase family protein, partial [Spirochaetia bacterium]|nr:hydroxymethylglutaryl-CoA synthase family protein [Spirochaetia bacterium]
VARPRPNTYAEPTQGAASVAMIVSEKPKILTLDVGANGYYTYEVMDTCRPSPDFETGDPDLSLLSYLDCAEHAFIEYKKKVGEVDYQEFFDMLSFHTPFGGLVKGVHRTMMRKFKKAPPAAIEEDFKKRVEPSFQYCQEVGNIYGATVFLATIGHILNATFDRAKRLGIFSYGSGCCSEFYSAIADQTSQDTLRQMQIGERLAGRYEVSIEEYDQLLVYNQELLMGTENKVLDFAPLSHVYQNHFEGRKLLVLNRINNFHREYAWT